MSTRPWQQTYMQRFYSPARGWVDGTTEFHLLCRSTTPRGSKILEIGTGGTNPTSNFLASLGVVYGLDPDPEVRHNTALTEAQVLDSPTFPYPSGSFDVCVTNYVLEHVEDAESHLQEVARVLKAGAAYIFRTPNRLHYVSVAAWLLPHWVHETVANRLRNLPAHAHGPHRTLYALNTPGAIRRGAQRAGLRVESLRLVEKEPSYGMSSPVLFLALTGYERLVNSTESLALLRSNIFAVLRKP